MPACLSGWVDGWGCRYNARRRELMGMRRSFEQQKREAEAAAKEAYAPKKPIDQKVHPL